MTDAEKREKVIRGLERCSGTAIFESECPIDCPYYLTTNPLGEDCCERLIKDALALLKEQEAVKPISGYGYYICGACRNPLNSASQKFCSECGRKVKWDD